MTTPTPIETIRQLIAAPYPAEVQPPSLHGIYDGHTNFFRSGPRRKIVVLFDTSGDYQYDPDLTEDDEYRMEADNEAFFARTTQELAALLKDITPRHDLSPADLPSSSDFDDEDREDKPLDDGSGLIWTSSFEGGYEMADVEQAVLWDLGQEYLVLFCHKVIGDDNYLCCTGACILPKDRQAPSPLSTGAPPSPRPPR